MVRHTYIKPDGSLLVTTNEHSYQGTDFFKVAGTKGKDIELKSSEVYVHTKVDKEGGVHILILQRIK
jgi:hypothetical protein